MHYGTSGLSRLNSKIGLLFHKLARFFFGKGHLKWNEKICSFYVLHLPRREDRKKLLEKELSTIKLSNNKGTLKDHTTWFDGYDGVKSWSKKLHISEYSFDLHWTVDPDPKFMPEFNGYSIHGKSIKCSNAESAIALGHIKMWKEFLKSGKECALFVEDDVKFSYRFEDRVNDIMHKELDKEEVDLIYLSTLPSEHGFTWDPHSKNTIRLYNGVWWLSGYILTRSGAEKLLANLPVVGPIDVWINHIFPQMKVYMSKENLIIQADNTYSDNTYSFLEKFYSNNATTTNANI